MKKNFTLPDAVLRCLNENPGAKFKATEIAEWIFKTYPEECEKKRKRSQRGLSDADLIIQITSEIGALRSRLQERNPNVKTTESRPREYFIENTDSIEINHIGSDEATSVARGSGSGMKEQELYGKLAEFLWSELNIYCKRINEKSSRNSQGAGGNRWLHPDLVGMEDLSNGWHSEVKKCVREYATRITKLWSFEVKTSITRSKVREYYYQAVSNSSWANFGYLVGSEIIGIDTMNELRMLSSLHGIGLIHLNVNNPTESQILIPSKERNEIDWDMANRLTEENKDFKKYVKHIREYYQTGTIRKSEWEGSSDTD